MMIEENVLEVLTYMGFDNFLKIIKKSDRRTDNGRIDYEEAADFL